MTPCAADLLIRYVGGGDYVYLDVTAEDFEGLKAARSRGAYVNQVIKPRYRHERRDPRRRRMPIGE